MTTEAPAKRRPGRPSRGQKHNFGVCLTPSEREAWEAKRGGLTWAEMLRRAVAHYPGTEG